MTTDEIKARVEKIRGMAKDYEAAHAEEDDLFLDFIRYISRKPTRDGRKALAVLQSKKIAFIRVCS